MKEIRDFFIYKNAVFAKSILKFFKEGSSMPVMVADDLDRKYLMKFYATGEGTHALAAEYIAIKLAALIGLPVLEPVFININKNTSINLSKRNEEVEELVINSNGINIGFPYLDNVRPFNEEYDSRYVSEDLRELIFLYDCFLLNIDRKESNPNILFTGTSMYVTDFGASFLFKEIFNKINYENSEDVLIQLKKNIFYSEKYSADLLRIRIEKLNPVIIDDLVNELPAQWTTTSEKELLKKGLKEKLTDKNYPGNIISKLKDLESESDEVIRERQKKKLNEFKKKFDIK